MANVNVPTNFAQKEKDINTKLQLYGIFTAFSHGKVPSNKQIDVALNSFLASKGMSSPSKNLSSEGQTLVQDVRKVVEETKKLLLSKNEGNLIQEFIWDAQGISGGNAAKPNAPIDRATAQQHGDQAVDGLKTLGRLILSNGQFRKLLDDAVVLARDMAGDAAQNAAHKVNPDEDRLKRIDDPAEDNTWHDVPDLSRQNLRQQAADIKNKNKPFSRDDVKQSAREGADQADQHPSDPTQDRQQAKQAGQAGAQHTMDNLRAKADQNVPEETKERAQNAKEAARQHTKNYLNKKMPQERREQTIWRLKKMIVEIQGHSDYQEAIETLLNLAETYAGHGRELGQQGAGSVKGAHDDTALTRAETNLRTLIERFANFTSADDLFDSLNQIYRDADRDPELKGWFRNLNTYVRRCLREQGYILQDESTQEWNQLYDKGQFLFRDRYRDHTDHLFDEVKFLADQFDQDPQNRAFGQAMEKLFLDLGRDENGNPAFKPHLIKDLTEVIIPAAFQNARYVPIPRIEVSDPMIDMVVENLVIESDNLFPNALEFGSDNYWRYGRKSIKNHRENKVMIAASGVQMDLRDVAYYFKKKQGFPSITDKGVMDIVMAGEGFSFKIAARNAHKTTDRTHFLVIDKIDVVVHNIDIKVKQSNHKLLFRIAKSLVLKAMKPAIQKAIEKQIKTNFEKADGFAYSIYREVEKSKETAKKNPEQASNIYQQYVNAFQKKMTDKKQKAEKAKKNTEVNVALTQKDSIFKDISLPGGISTKATEYKDLAAKGNKWESPVFGIGSAKESSNLPHASKVTRKPHQSRTPGVRGGNHPNANTSGSGSGAGYGSGSGPGYGSEYGSGYGSGNTGAGYPGTTGQNYGSSGTAGLGSQGLGGQGLGGQGLGGQGLGGQGLGGQTLGGSTNTGAASGLNREMDQAFSTAGQRATAGTSGNTDGQATFYDSITR